MKPIVVQWSHRLERQVATALCIGALAALSGCGGGGGGASPSTPPTIANLSYQPTLVPASGAGGFTINGSITFSDAGGDLTSLTIRVTDANGSQVSSTSAPIQGIAGQTSGTIVGSVVAAAPAAGAYTIHVSVSDSNGAFSNELSGPLDVVPVASQGRLVAAIGPGAASLRAANGRLYWSETGANALRSVTMSGGAVSELATRVVQIQAFAFAGTDLIWEDDRPLGSGACGTDTWQRVIHRTSSAGVTTVLASGFACAPGTGSDIVVEASTVYWTSSTLSPNIHVLNATPLAGGPTTTITSGFTPIAAMVGNAGALYWMENAFPNPGLIRRRTTATGTVDTVASFASSVANTFAVDATYVFYTTANFPRSPVPTETLVAQPLVGGAPLVLSGAISAPTKLATGAGQVAWIDATAVRAMPAAGGSIAALAAVATNAALDVLIDGGNVVWSETTGALHGETGTVKRVPLAGGGIDTLVQGGDAPRRLALDAQSRLHWSEGGSIGLAEGFSRVATLAAGGVQTVLSGIASAAPAFTVTASEVLVADRWRVKRLPLAGGMPTTVAADDGPIVSVTADGAWVYWNRADRLSARRAPLGGGAVTALVDQGPALPLSSGPILLGSDGKLYWTSNTHALVSVPAGGGTLAVVTPSASPCFAIDDSHAYFDFNTGSIAKQPLSGAAATPLASGGSCMFPANGPSVLNPFVLSDQFLYWRGVVDGFDTVSKVSVAGGRVTPVLIFDAPAGASGGNTSLAVDATGVYWTYPALQEIRASNR